jgi:hypothetical protein
VGWSGFLCSGDAVGEALEFGAIEHLGIDHANEQRFDRTLAKPVHDTLDCTAGHTLARLGRTIDKGAFVDAVLEISLFFQAAKDGANGRVFEGRSRSSLTWSAVMEPWRQTMSKMLRSSSPSSAGS